MRGLRGSLGLACSLPLLASFACKLPGTTAVDTAAAYTPTWISAEWNTPAGPPDLRYNRDATFHFDAICPSYAIGLRISAGQDSLSVMSNCDRATTFYLCASGGAPGSTVPFCASDPLETPNTSLTLAIIAAGAASDVGSPSQGLQLELFYCGDQSTMMFGPLRCTR